MGKVRCRRAWAGAHSIVVLPEEMTMSSCARLLMLATLVMAVAGIALAGNVTDADYPRALDVEGPVAVSWTDPAEFSEIRYSRNRFEARRGDWVRDIARHLAKRAATALDPGERLEVEITDIERAGEFEPAPSIRRGSTCAIPASTATATWSTAASAN